MSNHLAVIVHCTPEQIEQLAAHCFELSANGIVEQQDGFEAYFDSSITSKQELTAAFESIQSKPAFSFQIQLIESKNWNEEWEKNYEPIIIGEYCGIYAPFHEQNETTTHRVIINPKMAFGTGHHETTMLMIEQIQVLDFDGKDVLDLGSGTGILAILAAAEGAQSVVAIDFDEQAFAIMKENFVVNHQPHITAILGTVEDTDKKFDILLANINRNVLIECSEQIIHRLRSAGKLILCGFYMRDLPQLIDCYESLECEFESSKEKNNWCSAIFIKS